MTGDLGHFQQQMSEFLMHRDDTGIEQAGMRVYRNNVTSSLLSALEAQFPAVKNLVGEQFFGALAKEYLLENIPTNPSLTFFGASFADFIQNHEQCAALPWLADVATLEYSRRVILHARDDAVLCLDEIGRIPSDRLVEIILLFRHGVKLVESNWPIEAIRLEALSDTPQPVDIDQNTRHYYLLTRQDNSVSTFEIPHSRWYFLEKLQLGKNLGESWRSLQQSFALSDDALPSLLSQVLAAEIFTGYQIPKELT